MTDESEQWWPGSEDFETFDQWGKPDEFGVPSNYFGAVPEAFYGSVGRVALLAALLELQLLRLLWVLDATKGQAFYAGKPAAQLIRLCRTQLAENSQALAEPGIDLLNRVGAGLEERNAVVHSLWPSPRMDKAFGWRPVSNGKRQSDADLTSSRETSDVELRDLILRLVRLVDDLGRFHDHVNAAIIRGQPSGTQSDR